MIYRQLEHRLRAAVTAVLPDAATAAIEVRPSTDAKFGHYQTSALMAVAKQRKLNPRELAAQVLAKLDVAEWCEKVEVAGAGFLNFHLKPEAVAATLQAALRAEHSLVEQTNAPRTVVVDFSSPNVAKPMHVGHIRSTILGDSLARVLRLLGHRVVTDNHIGDWGTQFGKLLVGWKRELNREALEADPISEMERLYKKINSESDIDPATLEAARQELVKLQAGDAENLAIWHEMIRLSQVQFDTIYGRLGVTFDHTLGESFYNPRLKAVVEELAARGIAQESEGAMCVFSDGSVPPKEDPFLKQEDGEWRPNPCLVQKSDGAANYATTDLATLQYRMETWQPDEIIYVTDGRQQLHFRQVFAAFRRWQPSATVKLNHVWFGSILGEDGKPFKTRSGDTVKLADLLDEAEERAFAVVASMPKNAGLSEAVQREIGRVIGIGSVKYQDLLPNRQSDYVFSWDKMLALNGNTSPYLQYAYVRIRSIFRNAASEGLGGAGKITLAEPAEHALARHLLNFSLALEAMASEGRPNYLCNYLFELAMLYARFFEACPVLKAEADIRGSRLALCELTGRVLKQGLTVLGIETVEQM